MPPPSSCHPLAILLPSSCHQVRIYAKSSSHQWRNDEQKNSGLRRYLYFSYALIASLMYRPLFGCLLTFSKLSRSMRKDTCFCVRVPRAAYALRWRSSSFTFLVMSVDFRLNIFPCVRWGFVRSQYTFERFQGESARESLQLWRCSRHAWQALLRRCAGCCEGYGKDC